eukprot:scaffold21819_cov28-Isochrysis_galbana.AAC.1
MHAGGPPPRQIFINAALTSLSVPVLASVGGLFHVRHAQPPASRTCCLPCVRSAVRSGTPRARASMCPRCL